jgi:hypothetical protein
MFSGLSREDNIERDINGFKVYVTSVSNSLKNTLDNAGLINSRFLD